MRPKALCELLDSETLKGNASFFTFILRDYIAHGAVIVSDDDKEFAHLNEFMFRFNRRFFHPMSFQLLLGLGVLRTGLTYQEVYDDVVCGENLSKIQNCTTTR